MRQIFIFLIFGVPIFVYSQNKLLIPDTLSGTNFNLNLQYGSFEFYPGVQTSTMGTNGNILGPTLILDTGDFVDIKVKNELNDTTTIHWHGMHVSAENDGGPHTTIAPSATWNPSFTVMDKAATYWYHPHLHEKTNLHVSKGIAGFIIVRDKEEAAFELPRKYGIDDFPLVIQTKTFNANKEIVVPSNADSVVMVNATRNAELEVPSQVVRLRLLNGSSQRVFNLGLNNNKTFYQIASDGGLVSKPIQLARLQLAPGERAEILVDFSSQLGETIYLISYASEFSNGIYGATNPGMGMMQNLNNYNPNPINGTNFNLMQFKVACETSNPIKTIPANLVTVTPLLESNSDITRNVTLNPVSMGPNVLNGEFLINNVSFDMNVINYTIPLNNTEIWSITNQTPIAHPFHIHDVQFYVLDRNGVVVEPIEQGRKDVVLINAMETVRFITKFEDFANDPVPYMYHCHMLTHEDGGMMGQFSVVSTTNVNYNLNAPEIFELRQNYPNPFNPSTIINYQLPNSGYVSLKVYDLLGRQMAVLVDQQQSTGSYNVTLDGSNLASGIYFYELKSSVFFQIRKMMLLK